MPMQLGLPDALRQFGLTVELVPGWQTRGNSSFNPKGAVCHWTAGSKNGDRGSLHLCTHGRGTPGKAGYLPGPLCNVFLTRGGVAVVVAAGRANHAGTGGWRGLVGNSAVFGTEAENAGPGDPWTPAQQFAYPRVNAAYCHLMGRDASWVCRHMDWTPRKIDTNTWPLADMQNRTQALLNAGGDDMPLTEDDINRVAARVWDTVLAQFATGGGAALGPAQARDFLRHAAGFADQGTRTAGVANTNAVKATQQAALATQQATLAAQQAAVAAQVGDVDEKALAEALAPSLVDPLSKALAQSTSLSADETHQVVEKAVRQVLGSLGNYPTDG